MCLVYKSQEEGVERVKIAKVEAPSWTFSYIMLRHISIILYSLGNNGKILNGGLMWLDLCFNVHSADVENKLWEDGMWAESSNEYFVGDSYPGLKDKEDGQIKATFGFIRTWWLVGPWRLGRGRDLGWDQVSGLVIGPFLDLRWASLSLAFWFLCLEYFVSPLCFPITFTRPIPTHWICWLHSEVLPEPPSLF